VLLGVAYTLSPLTIVVACGAVAMVYLSGRGLPGTERRYLAAILIVATLAGVCRIAFLLAGGRFDRRPALVEQSDDEQLAA